MKRLLIVLLPILVVTLLLPKEVKAVTLKEYEDAVVKYTKELEEKEAKIARGKEEIAAVKKTIAETQSKIEETEKEIDRLQEEIEKSQKEIEKKDKVGR